MKMVHLHAFILFFLISLVPTQAVVGQQSRPISGSGLVIVRPLNPDRKAEAPVITFYREPGVSRISEISVREIPRLSFILEMPPGEYPLAVMGKKGNWLRIAYDDAGREGWVAMARWWDYFTWPDFLKGRVGRLIPNLNNTYTLRAGPTETAHQLGVLSGGERLKIIEVANDWVLAITDSGVYGWLPWRDDDGRTNITVEKNRIQKY